MTNHETIAIMGVLKTAYPAYYRDISKTDAEAAVKLWAEMLSDIPAAAVTAAVKSYIATDTKGFPPVIGAIRTLAMDAIHPPVAPGEIWDEVYRLLNSSISPDASEQAYASMSDVCREAVMAVGGWYALSMSPENDSFTRRTFLQAAQRRIDRDRAAGIPFDRSKVNQLVPREPLQLGGGSGG